MTAPQQSGSSFAQIFQEASAQENAGDASSSAATGAYVADQTGKHLFTPASGQDARLALKTSASAPQLVKTNAGYALLRSINQASGLSQVGLSQVGSSPIGSGKGQTAQLDDLQAGQLIVQNNSTPVELSSLNLSAMLAGKQAVNLNANGKDGLLTSEQALNTPVSSSSSLALSIPVSSSRTLSSEVFNSQTSNAQISDAQILNTKSLDGSVVPDSVLIGGLGNSVAKVNLSGLSGAVQSRATSLPTSATVLLDAAASASAKPAGSGAPALADQLTNGGLSGQLARFASGSGITSQAGQAVSSTDPGSSSLLDLLPLSGTAGTVGLKPGAGLASSLESPWKAVKKQGDTHAAPPEAAASLVSLQTGVFVMAQDNPANLKPESGRQPALPMAQVNSLPSVSSTGLVSTPADLAFALRLTSSRADSGQGAASQADDLGVAAKGLFNPAGSFWADFSKTVSPNGSSSDLGANGSIPFSLDTSLKTSTSGATAQVLANPFPAVIAPLSSSLSTGLVKPGAGVLPTRSSFSPPDIGVNAGLFTVQSSGPGAPNETATTGAPLSASAPVSAPENDAPHSEPLRGLRVQLAGADNQRIDMRLLERSGSLSVTVRSNDEGLTRNLQEGLPELSSRLAAQHYQAEVWTPGSSASTHSGLGSNGSGSNDAGSSGAGSDGSASGGSAGSKHNDSSPDQQRNPNSHSGQSQQRDRNSPPAWVQQLASFDAARLSGSGGKP